VPTLIVVSHPDDEVLGAGGLAAGRMGTNDAMHSCILSREVRARGGRPDLDELDDHIRAAHEILGMPAPILGAFPNIAFNTVPHIELVQFIEQAIEQTRADTIITHHPGDLNNDHRHTSLAALAAARLFQRRAGVPALRTVLYMEILSATDWSFAGMAPAFQPTAFFPLGEELLERKLAALRAYQGVMRPFPHPRSEEIIRGLAALRGGQAGVMYAEAFQSAFHRLDRAAPAPR
jgi:LmbE family N-acetylglucosaminyl deacetylase